MDKEKINIQKGLIETIEKLVHKEGFTQEFTTNILGYIDFRSELGKESDRGCALLAASYLDSILEQMLKSKLIGTNKQLESLFDFNGPLGTFSSKILLSYSLGLISKARMDDLQTIRKIRNEFGHSPSIISFSSKKINSLCNNLKMVLDSNNEARRKFISSVSFIAGGIMSEKNKGEKFKLRDNLDQEGIKNMQEQIASVLQQLK